MTATSCATVGGNGESGGQGGGVGQMMPPITVRALEGGRAIDLHALRGKVVLVDIWASWCAPCKEEMPMLDEMAARLKRKGVEIIAVSIDEQRASALTFLRSRPHWSLTLAHDPEGKVPELLQPPKMPTSYIIDSRGILRYVNTGFERADAQRLEQRLLALTSE
ncbi:MAG TPA: TlpA disulfide reductase family protein [Polyangia bacterium]|nr:TlpA disulfide reductase family protein [Polyangia bacterium]